jgi:hypothetical protein
MSRIALALLAVATLGAASSDPRDGREVIAQMKQHGHMYRTLTFVQTTTFPDRPAETWYESAQVPGMLRIDMAPLDSQRVTIFRNDSVYSSRIGRPVRSRPYVHSLLVLLTDVFAVPAESSVAKLSTLGFDLSKMHEDRYDGRKVWVVGAERGDTTTPQFWIDADRWYMVRMIERTPGQAGQPASTFDSKVLQHQNVNGYWVETEMAFSVNGREIQREVYNDIHVNVPLDSTTFTPGEYHRPSWIRPTP